jgi:hypothetical protein
MSDYCDLNEKRILSALNMNMKLPNGEEIPFEKLACPDDNTKQKLEQLINTKKGGKKYGKKYGGGKWNIICHAKVISSIAWWAFKMSTINLIQNFNSILILFFFPIGKMNSMMNYEQEIETPVWLYGQVEDICNNPNISSELNNIAEMLNLESDDMTDDNKTLLFLTAIMLGTLTTGATLGFNEREVSANSYSILFDLCDGQIPRAEILEIITTANDVVDQIEQSDSGFNVGDRYNMPVDQPGAHYSEDFVESGEEPSYISNVNVVEQNNIYPNAEAEYRNREPRIDSFEISTGGKRIKNKKTKRKNNKKTKRKNNKKTKRNNKTRKY